LWFAVVAAEPEFRVIIDIALIAQPTAFREVMADGATDRIERASVAHRNKEFGENEAVGRLNDVLSERPPAEIVNLLNFGIGAIEKRDVCGKPIPGVCVGDEVSDVFVFDGIEASDVMSVRGRV
jgi:hypothetical protein